MADTKISNLTALAGASVATGTDVLAIVDDSVTTTKKILIDELAVAMAATQAEANTMTSTNTLLTPNINKIVLGTTQASTSSSSINFTSIPAGVRRITVCFVGVSTNGTADLFVQIGDAGGLETTGYLGSYGVAGGSANATTGFGIYIANAAYVIHGTLTLTLVDSTTFTWVAAGSQGSSDSASVAHTTGSKSLSAELDRLSIVTTDTFDLGSINISYER